MGIGTSSRGGALALALAATLCAVSRAYPQETPAAEEPPAFTTSVSLTQFVQGVVAGGRSDEGAYGGRLDVGFVFNPAGLGGWKNGTLEAKVLTRYGETANAATGAILPVNTALLDPAAEGTETGVVTLRYTHLIPFGKPGDMVLLSAGKFFTIDLITDAFLGGDGITGWMNLAQNGPPHEARNFPSVTLGGTAVLILEGEPIFSLSVMDPASSQRTSGLGDLFEKGVSLFPALVVPTRFFGEPGHHGVRTTWSSQEVTPFDELSQLLLPPAERDIDRVSGPWTFTYTGNQYVSASESLPRTGWGAFWQLGIGEDRTNAVRWFYNLGIGGTSPFDGRAADSFGVGFAYVGLSSALKEALDPLTDIGDEYEVEAYYNLAVTSWLRVTADLQLVEPFRDGVDPALVPGLRVQLHR